MQHLPRRDHQQFETFTGRDSGKSLLKAMQVWAEASHLPSPAFRKLVVGRGLTIEGAASLQAMARTLADPRDPAALVQAGPQLAAALLTAGRGNVAYGLSYAQGIALYADAQGFVPDDPTRSPPTAAPIVDGALGPATVLGGAAPLALPEMPVIVSGAALLRFLAVAGTGAAALTFLFWPSHLADGTVDGQGNKPGPGPSPADPPPVRLHPPGPVPPSPIAKPGGGGFTHIPTHRVEGNPPAPATTLPHTMPGAAADTLRIPTVTPMARPKVTPEEQQKREEVIRSKGLPTRGPNQYVPLIPWTSSQPLPRGKHQGYLDIDGSEWVMPKGRRVGAERHWDVQVKTVEHKTLQKRKRFTMESDMGDKDDYDEKLERQLNMMRAATQADLEAQAHETKSCKIGDLLEVTARLDLSGSWDDPTPSTILPQGQIYRAQDLKGRGWDLVLVSGEGPPELRIMNGQVPQFFKVLPP